MTWDVLAPGTWLIFGIIGLPVYTVILGWFLGAPKDTRRALMAVGYFLGLTIALWGGLFVLTVVIDVVFF